MGQCHQLAALSHNFCFGRWGNLGHFKKAGISQGIFRVRFLEEGVGGALKVDNDSKGLTNFCGWQTMSVPIYHWSQTLMVPNKARSITFPLPSEMFLYLIR